VVILAFLTSQFSFDFCLSLPPQVYAQQMGSALVDKDTRNMLLSELPQDMRLAIDGLFEGDMSAMRIFLESQPELEQANIDMLMSILEGDTDGFKSMFGNLLGDADNIKQTRQTLMDNPEMAEALGIDMKVVRNDRAWNKMIAEAKAELGGDGLNGLREKAASHTDRKFRIPGMA